MLHKKRPAQNMLHVHTISHYTIYMATSLKNLLQTIVPAQSSWKTDLNRNWKQVIGHLSDHVHLLKIYENALVLGVKDSSWLQEMYLLSPLLIETINKSLDKPRIIKLHFKNVGDGEHIPQHQKTPPKENKVAQPKARKERALTTFEQKTLDQIEDPEMRKALKELLLTCYQEKK